MRDINDIVENNNRTWGPVIENLTRQGRYVVAQYDGLHLVAVESFTTLTGAQYAAEKVNATLGSRSELHFPLQLARINDPTGCAGGAVIVNQPARVPLQGDPDSFAYRQAVRREEQRHANRANQSLTALQAAALARPRAPTSPAARQAAAALAAALARPRDLSLETENTAYRAFDRAAGDLAREVRARRVFGSIVDDLTREERDRVAEGGLVSWEV